MTDVVLVFIQTDSQVVKVHKIIWGYHAELHTRSMMNREADRL